MSDPTNAPDPLAFLKGAGELASLIRSFDWSATPLGAIGTWPQSLKTATGLLLLSPVPIVMLWGEDGIMIYNDAYSGFAGARHPGLLGSKVREGWVEVADFNDNVMRVGLAGGTLAYKDQQLTLYRNGRAEDVWMNLDYSPVLDESGEPAGVIAIVVETTQRVLADRRNAAERQRQEQMFSQMPGFVAILSGPDHVFHYVNDAYIAISGPRDFLGRGVREVFPELRGQGIYELLDQVYATGERFVARALPIDLIDETQSRFIDFVYEPVRDERGRVGGVFVGGYDVTETHRAVAALRETEGKLRMLNADLERQVTERAREKALTWQISPDLHGVANAQGFFESTNPAWQTVLGWSAEEIARTPLLDLIHPDDLSRTIVALEGLLRGEPALRFENRYRTRAGGYRWLSWVAIPEGDKFYCSARDVTDEKTAEQDLAVAQDALRQSQKMEAVGQLTGGIAHDFNNLLMGISGSLDMLQAKVSQGRIGELERYITAAQGASRRAASLTHRLLAFSRRQTLDPKPTDVNRLTAGMEELVRRTLGPEVTLETVLAGGVWNTLVDPGQLENALLNLCVNARDAMPSGGKLTIETGNRWLDKRAALERDLEPGQYVSLCVSDTGVGMTAEVIARAFDPFFTTKPIGQGTGLGLSMIYGFARQSGGQVRIYSEPGHGAMVCIYLPRHVGSTDQVEAAAELSDAPRASSNETVLVVDDEALIRMLVVEVLEELGYATVEAADGPSALKILNGEGRVDLLVSDVGLPGGMNGRQLADAARLRRPDLKVLFITGYAENAAINNGHLDSGMHVLTKPFAMEALASRVKEIIDG